MKRIFLAPKSNERSHANFGPSLLEGRTNSFVEPYLTEKEKEILSPYEILQIWGNKEVLRPRWEKMRPGDYVLFYAKGVFEYSARVVLTKFNIELGEKLWPVDKNGNSWPCLFFVDNVKKINIPIKVVQELAEYEPTWDRVQGFMPLRESGIQAIENKFGSIEKFLDQSPEVYEVLDTFINTIREETLTEEKGEGKEKALLYKEASSYTDSGISHVTTTAPAKKRVESKKQKMLVAELEDYACQICNWSLSWKNTKGKEVYRIDIDHIIDKAKGGTEELHNLWALCPNCHVKKTLGVIQIDPDKKSITENGESVRLHHDNHLNWYE